MSSQWRSVDKGILRAFSWAYWKLAASPCRRGLTVASRLWLCIFKQSHHDCDLTTVASRLWLYLFNKIGLQSLRDCCSAYLTKWLHITGAFGAPNSSSAASCAFGEYTDRHTNIFVFIYVEIKKEEVFLITELLPFLCYFWSFWVALVHFWN